MLDLPDRKSGTIDVTNMDSSNVAEFISDAIVDGGDVKIEVNWTGAAGQLALLGDLGGVAQKYYVNFPGGTGQPQFVYYLLVNSEKMATPLKGAIRRTFTAKLSTGAVTVNTQ